MQTGNRFHTLDEVEQRHWHQFYEIYIQKLIPVQFNDATENYVYDYHVKEKDQKALKERKRMIKQASRSRMTGDGSDEEEEEEGLDVVSNDSNGSNMTPEHYEMDQMFWDEEELEFMQLDDLTAKREYYKVTCTQCVDKQDQDYFIIEKDIARWPDPAVEYQYILENMVLKQVIKPVTGEVNINICGLMIRNGEHRFKSEDNWLAYLRCH